MRFDAATHRYYNDNDMEIISVTQLLSKMGLAPDYGAVPPEVLAAKARRGSLIHEEIKEFLQEGKEPLTEEAYGAMRWLNERNAQDIGVELMVGNDRVAGTFDWLGIIGGKKTLIDWKTTASFNERYLSWQLSLYDYLGGFGCERLLCVRLDGDQVEVHEVAKHPKEEIEELLDCHSNVTEFVPWERRNAIGLAGSYEVLELEKVEALIAETELSIKEAKKREKELKDAILKAMEASSVSKVETEKLKITYIAEYKRNTVDTNALKKEQPEIYQRYLRQSTTSASVKIEVKEDA